MSSSYSEKVEIELTWDAETKRVRLDDGTWIYDVGGPSPYLSSAYPQHIDAARRVYDANRELLENETRLAGAPWNVGTMSVEGDRLAMMWPDAVTSATRDELARFHEHSPERLAYFDKHCTKPLGEDEIEIEYRGERLKFERATFDPGEDEIEHRAQLFVRGVAFSPFYSGTCLSPWNAAKARAWWKANVTLPEGYEFDDERGAREVEAKEKPRDWVETKSGHRLVFDRAYHDDGVPRIDCGYGGTLRPFGGFNSDDWRNGTVAIAQAWWLANYQYAPGERFDETSKRVVRDEPENELERLRDLGKAATHEALDRLVQERDDARAEVLMLKAQLAQVRAAAEVSP